MSILTLDGMLISRIKVPKGENKISASGAEYSAA